MSYSATYEFCEYVGHIIGILIKYDDDNDQVIDIDCDYKNCGHSHRCKIYQKYLKNT